MCLGMRGWCTFGGKREWGGKIDVGRASGDVIEDAEVRLVVGEPRAA